MNEYRSKQWQFKALIFSKIVPIHVKHESGGRGKRMIYNYL